MGKRDKMKQKIVIDFITFPHIIVKLVTKGNQGLQPLQGIDTKQTLNDHSNWFGLDYIYIYINLGHPEGLW